MDGAEPGDTLQVELLDFEPGDWGWTAAIPGFGLLADAFPEPALRISHVGGGVAEMLPGVRVPIAPFSLGDGHAAQGDGEVCGTAVETPMRARVRLTVRKDVSVVVPEFRTSGPLGVSTNTAGWYACDAVGPDLLTAAREATSRMIDRLGAEHGLAAIDAYLLLSIAGDLRISEIVDMPNVIVTMVCPRSIFG